MLLQVLYLAGTVLEVAYKCFGPGPGRKYSAESYSRENFFSILCRYGCLFETSGYTNLVEAFFSFKLCFQYTYVRIMRIWRGVKTFEQFM